MGETIINKILAFILFITTIYSNDITGQYKLVGLNVVDYDFVRVDTDIFVTEKSGYDITPRKVYTLPQGENIDYDSREPYPLFALNLAGVDLSVYFAEDGTATILEGSTYPTESSGEGCFTEEIAVPIQEDFFYSDNLNSGQYIPIIDILGLDSASPYKGIASGSISISGSSVFDNIPDIPTEVSVPFDIDTSSVFNRSNGIISANTILSGFTSGYIIKRTDMYSFIDYLEFDPTGAVYNENNPPPRPSLYLEWHAIDGLVNQSGFGDFIGQDEDGDGTDFDSIYGLDQIKTTKVNSSNDCGPNPYHIVGDHADDLRTVKYNECLKNGDDESTCSSNADDWITQCIDVDEYQDNGNNLYIIDLEQDPNFNWGGYLTWNSALYHVTQDSTYLVDDSNEDYNSSCQNDCSANPDLEELIDCTSSCSGRFIFEYTPQCIPSFNMRYFMAELEEECQEVDKDDCGVCFGNGIPDGYCDCNFSYRDCAGNCDENPENDDLSCFGCDGVSNSNLEYDECGLCGGQGKSIYCYDFDGDGIGNQNISQQYCPYEKIPNNWVLDCTSLDNNADIISNDLYINRLYPNPFNPNINIEFSINRPQNIIINVYDINGRLVQNIENTFYDYGMHNISWESKSVSSGTYLIEIQSESQTVIRQINLIK